MRKLADRYLYSATDLCNFAACHYLTQLDLRDQIEHLERAEEDEQAKLVIKKGEEHEKRYLATLRETSQNIITVPPLLDAQPEEALDATITLLKQGASYVYQAFLFKAPFNGYADFLKRVERPSSLGSFSYEVIDTKLSKTEKASYIIQLCFYSEILAEIQGSLPTYAHIVAGDMRLTSFKVSDYYSYYNRLKRDFLRSVANYSNSTLYPEPCPKCTSCNWRNLCKATWQKDDHLSLVANITRSQRIKLEQSGITTCAQLADPGTPPPPNLHPEAFARLRDQATLQRTAHRTNTPIYRVIPPQEGGRGFALLPPPDEGDLFYDIEGDPLLKEDSLKSSNFMLRDGLEYLHGFSWRNADGTFTFHPFWALTKPAERHCFEQLMDFLIDRTTRYPNAKIYHYSPYEIAALKRLSSQYPTRTKELDTLLRGEKFCDLYTVVKQSIRVSEPRYSIKNLERFYSKKRDHEVKDGGASIVWFEEYLETKNPQLLDAIRDYNQKDCDSMIELYDWLSMLKHQSAQELGIEWDTHIPRDSDVAPIESPTEISKAEQQEQRVAHFRSAFRIDDLQSTREPNTYTDEELLRTRLFYLSDFYRREMKPQWWNHFRRKELLPMERAEDPEVITGCTRDTTRPAEKLMRSRLLYYTFPQQECKLTPGDSLYDIENERSYGTVHEINYDAGLLTIKLGGKLDEAARLELSRRPLDPSDPLIKGLDRFLERIGDFDLGTLRTARSYPYPALVDILLRDLPVFLDGPRTQIVSVTPADPAFRQQLTEAALKLDRSYLFIQGPPGTGKTFHGARMAVSLMKAGKRLAVMSNSHKAIINFLCEVDIVAHSEKFTFRGGKKSNPDDLANLYTSNRGSDAPPAQIHDYYDHDAIAPADYQLIAGTAWTFCRDEHDQRFDYLIVDEASQLSLAHLAASGVCAENLILIGDPRQLPQPLQGIHPAGLDQSPLEYLLGEHGTVPPERGVFLNECRRMHTEICDLLSTHVYDSRLSSPAENGHQRIIPETTFSLNQPAGYLFHPCEHDGNTQTSLEEANALRQIYQELLSCSFRAKDGTISKITPSDIMVIAPYNMQVQLLRRTLPDADVGTIDLFQGREAPVVLISMTTSSMDEAPRGLEFLFSQQRINVALSRAKALAIVLGSPKLFQARCTKPEQMKLVNFFCALGERKDAEKNAL
jgi:predicted RecB family nuclease